MGKHKFNNPPLIGVNNAFGKINVLTEKEKPVLTEKEKPLSNLGVEEEQALVINSDNPQSVIQKILDLDKIGWGYHLAEPINHTIVDTYYNTLTNSFKKNSLRIRKYDGVNFVTIKGKKFGEIESKRSEFEVEWPWNLPSPEDVADLFELVKVQTRVTDRITRNVVDIMNKKVILVAELAMDKVTYSLPNGKEATFYEVELEKKSDKVVYSLKSLVESLMSKIPELKKWDHSKLATGKAIELALGVNVDEDNVISKGSLKTLAQLAEVLKS